MKSHEKLQVQIQSNWKRNSYQMEKNGTAAALVLNPVKIMYCHKKNNAQKDRIIILLWKLNCSIAYYLGWRSCFLILLFEIFHDLCAVYKKI